MERNETLKALKQKHKLTAKQIAEMLECEFGTVKNWLKDPSVVSYRVMPKTSLKLLMILLDASSESGHLEESEKPS